MLRKLCSTFKRKFYNRSSSLQCWVLKLIVLILMLIISIVYLINLNVLCPAWQVSTAVNVLCELYKTGEIEGNLCHDLCTSRTVNLGPCQTHHSAKEVVFEAKWNNVKIVIKSDYLELNKYDSLGFKTSFETVQYPTLAEFSEIVTNHLRENVNISLNSDNVLSKLWSQDVNELTIQTNLPSIMNSIWSLVQQNEYILMKCFEETKIFPKVVGTCGHFYAIEFIDQLESADWSSRVLSALKLIDFSIKLDNTFHQPLHLCDVKYNHFGIDSEKNVRVLDADTVYFKSVIDKMVSSGEKCNNDVDCSFWDCKSRCHSEKKKCIQQVINNNLQVICKRIFLGRRAHSVILKPFESGLLNPSPYSGKTDLLSLLNDCVKLNNPNLNIGTNKSNREMLMVYLQNELQQFSG